MIFENIYIRNKMDLKEILISYHRNNGSNGDKNLLALIKELISEIFTKINNAKDKPKKIEVLRQYDTPGMRMILKGAFDPKIEWDLPEGTPPYIANEAPAGTEHTYLEVEEQRDYTTFSVGGNDQLNKIRKETLFIQMLEGLTR